MIFKRLPPKNLQVPKVQTYIPRRYSSFTALLRFQDKPIHTFFLLKIYWLYAYLLACSNLNYNNVQEKKTVSCKNLHSIGFLINFKNEY